MENYHYIRTLSKTDNKTVSLLKKHVSGKRYVAKTIDLSSTSCLCRDNDYDKVMLLKKIKAISDLRHPHLLTYHDFFFDRTEKAIILISEYCDGGTLEDRIRNILSTGITFHEDQIMQWFVQILMALHYLHSNQKSHGNLKPGNIYISIDSVIKAGDIDVFSTCISSLQCSNMTSRISGCLDVWKDDLDLVPHSKCRENLSPIETSDQKVAVKKDMKDLGKLFDLLQSTKIAMDGRIKDLNNPQKCTSGSVYSKDFRQLHRILLNQRNLLGTKDILLLPIVKKHLDLFIEDKENLRMIKETRQTMLKHTPCSARRLRSCTTSTNQYSLSLVSSQSSGLNLFTGPRLGSGWLDTASFHNSTGANEVFMGGLASPSGSYRSVSRCILRTPSPEFDSVTMARRCITPSGTASGIIGGCGLSAAAVGKRSALRRNTGIVKQVTIGAYPPKGKKLKKASRQLSECMAPNSARLSTAINRSFSNCSSYSAGGMLHLGSETAHDEDAMGGVVIPKPFEGSNSARTPYIDMDSDDDVDNSDQEDGELMTKATDSPAKSAVFSTVPMVGSFSSDLNRGSSFEDQDLPDDISLMSGDRHPSHGETPDSELGKIIFMSTEEFDIWDEGELSVWDEVIKAARSVQESLTNCRQLSPDKLARDCDARCASALNGHGEEAERETKEFQTPLTKTKSCSL